MTKKPFIIAGLCLIENEFDAIEIAEFLKEQGVDVFRAKPIRDEGTHPPKRIAATVENFAVFHRIKEIMPIAVEAYHNFQLYDWFDYIWTPARQMQNYNMLKQINAERQHNVILKRGFGNTIDEVIGATEYLKSVQDLWICERGIVTFDRQPAVRWRPDILGIVQLKQKGFNVLFDTSHSCGKADYVIPMCLAALAAGADGLMIEVHPDPKLSISGDREQMLNFEQFKELMQEVKKWEQGKGN